MVEMKECVFNLSWGESQLVEVPRDEDQQSQPVSLEFTMLSLDFDMILLFSTQYPVFETL